VGYVISGSKTIYFAGDTDLFDEMSELGPVDVGLVPIWGWGPGLGRGGGHLDPVRAAEAVARIRPDLVVPIHWGTYFPIHLGLMGRPGFVDVPPVEFLAALKERAPELRAEVLRPGEGLDLD
jgi:L-ascorbate metabolism protein UlaG (beta-lactamase superfamily)